MYRNIIFSAFTPHRHLPSLAVSFSSVWLWALMTPVIFGACENWPLDREVWHKNLSVHLVICIAFAWLDALLTSFVARRVHAPGAHLSQLSRFFGSSFINTFSYVAVAVTAHAHRYYQLLSERKAANAELQRELLQAQLQALQMQLRPHFLFNALNTIASLICAGQNPQAIRTLAGLAELLRAVLKSDTALLVPLKQEMAFLEKYLGIEKVRFEDRLRTRLTVDGQALDALVPSLILQPLVENALQHGIDSALGTGSVDIEVTRRDEMLWMRVWNSGAGPDQRSPKREAMASGSEIRARASAGYMEIASTS